MSSKTRVGRLWGVGLGPGDPELVTVKAARLIGAADVVAYHSARHGRSIARALAEPYLRGDQVEEPLIYPVTTETTDHPGGYQGAMDEFYAECAARLAAHLDAGRDVVVLAEGDPLFYGSYMHMHKRLAHRYPTEVVPGVTSVSGAAAVLGRPLVERDEVLTVLPGTLPPEALAERLASTDSAAVLKLGRTFENVRAALDKAGRLDEAWYVERATTEGERVAPLAEVDPATVPYFSLALVPSPLNAQNPEATGNRDATGDLTAAGDLAATGAGAAERDGGVARGEVVVVGLGPAGRPWLTPEAQEALAAADDLVGYGPYLDRVPANPRQRRHASDNRVEAERAAHALELAQAGSRVVVVSSGDPGVFAMASAVLEVASEPRFHDVPVRVLPGLTAAQAVASRVGAPLGHDFCVISLSDRLKPWEVITERLVAAAKADLVLALYNPASRSRRWQVAAMRDLLLEHRGPDTVVVVGRDVGGPGERVRVTTLAELDPDEVDMRTLLMIGSSTTRVVRRGNDDTVVFTPRRYPA
ncbi:precorrin-2 C20-methyltransferase / precorrin-3B C17-methyltransferase [Streptoalloteichus tenebrarius]|uniref:Precorrin-2 C20-methyltransferase / precorrin-3B C17-methyltransferase n=1 Tax=Streptoalloteichus tenebrarius (strain ATCC 17920 / DSM 40477 / JCM 4838 / CBS 697.72 / NBRC 16177 / NCIMB 11028 / NRRL B-12390 / A12253. 1 / ISP 5477) TaxID=1933 RepID=A0ABT1I159_STRSD|nr:precorrin-2 C(20)-methyltransferase [Streptoalloteichus tenebrarius]MCP2261512.1 precorrin-2 C20-methyltransferase / precorrin-3B C17-methyltransferase [Streptoalloteichus tenebrarius]BFE99328.1 precorrin-2 C(20)-methyltransferase [Streptoalloteichus tenebrarius]